MYYRRDEVAVLIAAHNEQLVIAEAVRAARGPSFPASHVFRRLGRIQRRDGRSGREAGAVAWDLSPNRGKAGAIRAGLAHFRIPERFPLLLLLDADSTTPPDYLRTGLPLFTDQDVVAVAGRRPPRRLRPTRGMGLVLTSYRERTYVCTQYLHKFGQAARVADAVAIVPGFASMYRTDVLDRIDIDAPRPVDRDFNMTFEVHARATGTHRLPPRVRRRGRRRTRRYSETIPRRCAGGASVSGKRSGVTARASASSGVRRRFGGGDGGVRLVLTLMVPALVITAVAAVASTMLSGFAAEVAGPSPPFAVGPLAAAFLVAMAAMTAFVCIVTATRPAGCGCCCTRSCGVWDAVLCLRALVAALGRPSDGRWRSPDRRAALSPAST